MCINMYAGEYDVDWLANEKLQAAQFKARGMKVEFSEEKGEDHVMRTLDGAGAAVYLNSSSEARHGCTSSCS